MRASERVSSDADQRIVLVVPSGSLDFFFRSEALTSSHCQHTQHTAIRTKRTGSTGPTPEIIHQLGSVVSLFVSRLKEKVEEIISFFLEIFQIFL